jgi:uncharacterized protein YjbJ (UPF0337 family)
MNQLKAKGKWNIVKGKAKKILADIKEDPFLYETGQKDELVGRQQARAGRVKENITKVLRKHRTGRAP